MVVRLGPFPLMVPISKKKNWYLNLNNYRNAHHMVLSKAKSYYHEEVVTQGLFREIPFGPPYEFTYIISFPTRRRVDLMNVGAVLDKFVSDVLVAEGYIMDDHREIIPTVLFKDGGYIKGVHEAFLEIRKA